MPKSTRAKSSGGKPPARRNKRRRKPAVVAQQAAFDFDKAQNPAPSELLRWAPYVVVILVALLVHARTLNAPFHFDDLSLPGDPAMGLSDGWIEILSDPARTRPLTYLTYWMNDQVHGFTPWGFHVLNLGLFAALLTVLAALYRKLVPQVAAVAALAVVALHPLQTEPVAYIFARATLLAALLAACAWLEWVREHRWRSLAWFTLAMLAKEEAAALPVFLAGYELFWRKASLRPAIKPLAAMAAVVALSAARLFYAIAQTPGSGAGEAAGVSSWSYLLTQGRAVWLYLRLLFAPYGQNFDRDWPASAGFDLETAAAWIALAALVAAGGWFVRKHREIYWWLGGLILLVPTSSLMPLADLTAERRMMLPLLSLSLGVGLLFKRLPLRPAIGALLVLCVALGAASWRRHEVWLSAENLWSDVVSKSPNKVRPKLQLARALEIKGAVSEAERLSLLEAAHGLDPSNSVPIAELGVFHLRREEPDKALEAFERALALDPEDPQIRANIGSSLWLLGRRSEALESFRTALAIDPCNFDARNNLVLAMKWLGSSDEYRRLAVAPPDCRFSAAQRAAIAKAQQ